MEIRQFKHNGQVFDVGEGYTNNDLCKWSPIDYRDGHPIRLNIDWNALLHSTPDQWGVERFVIEEPAEDLRYDEDGKCRHMFVVNASPLSYNFMIQFDPLILGYVPTSQIAVDKYYRYNQNRELELVTVNEYTIDVMSDYWSGNMILSTDDLESTDIADWKIDVILKLKKLFSSDIDFNLITDNIIDIMEDNDLYRYQKSLDPRLIALELGVRNEGWNPITLRDNKFVEQPTNYYLDNPIDYVKLVNNEPDVINLKRFYFRYPYNSCYQNLTDTRSRILIAREFTGLMLDNLKKGIIFSPVKGDFIPAYPIPEKYFRLTDEGEIREVRIINGELTQDILHDYWTHNMTLNKDHMIQVLDGLAMDYIFEKNISPKFDFDSEGWFYYRYVKNKFLELNLNDRITEAILNGALGDTYNYAKELEENLSKFHSNVEYELPSQ